MPVIIKKKDALRHEALERYKRQKIVIIFDQPASQDESPLGKSIELIFNLVKKTPDMKMVGVSSPPELEKAYMQKRAFVLLVNFNLYENPDDLMALMVNLKRLKNIPFLFYTDNSNELVMKYRQHLFVYQEADDFIALPATKAIISQKLKKLMDGKYRKAKRFNLSDNIFYTLPMQGDKKYDAQLMDLSMGGLYIKTAKEVFNPNQQIQIQIPLGNYKLFNRDYGELLKLAVRVKRVNISGNEAGCELNYLEEDQQILLKNIIERISLKNLSLKGKTKKLKKKASSLDKK